MIVLKYKQTSYATNSIILVFICCLFSLFVHVTCNDCLTQTAIARIKHIYITNSSTTTAFQIKKKLTVADHELGEHVTHILCPLEALPLWQKGVHHTLSVKQKHSLSAYFLSNKRDVFLFSSWIHSKPCNEVLPFSFQWHPSTSCNFDHDF